MPDTFPLLQKLIFIPSFYNKQEMVYNTLKDSYKDHFLSCGRFLTAFGIPNAVRNPIPISAIYLNDVYV